MPQLSTKVADRLSSGIKRFQPIIASAKSRDVNESDTVIIVTDVLSEIFGYDKYSEITSEHTIRSTYCDLGIKLDGTLQFLVEVKAIGIDLKDSYVKQAVDYSANQGTEWVALTNGETWRVYKVTFAKPIDQELVLEFHLSQLNPKKSDDLEVLYRLTKEGWLKSALGEFHEQRQALSRFFLAAFILSDSFLEGTRRELRRMSPEVKISIDQIRNVLTQEVLKREVVEGEKADEARKKVARFFAKSTKARADKAQTQQKGVAKEMGPEELSEESETKVSPDDEKEVAKAAVSKSQQE